MAGKKKGKKGGDEDVDGEEGADNGEDGPKSEPSARAGYIGLGLIGSVVIGFDPLRDAFQGNGSFENAILRYLACVAVCVIGAGTIGRLLDAGGQTVPILEPAADETDDEATSSTSGGQPAVGQSDKSINPGSASSGPSGRQDS